MLLSANEWAVSLSQLGTRDLNLKAWEKFCKIIVLISEILLLFLLFNSLEAKYSHNNANCIDFSKRVNYYYESIMADFADKYCSEDSNFSGHRGQRKSPLLLSFLYLHFARHKYSNQMHMVCTYVHKYVHMYIHLKICFLIGERQ